MKKITSLFLILSLTILGACFEKKKATSEEDKQIEELLEISGLKKQIKETEEGFGAVLLAQTPGSDEKKEKFVTILTDTFKEKDINNKIKSALKKQLSEEEVNDLLKWYNSDLGKKIIDEENASSSADSYAQMNEITPKLLKDEERVKAAKKIVELLKIVDLIANVEINSIKSVSNLISDKYKTTPEQEKVIDEELEKQAFARANKYSLPIALFSHRNLTIDELNEYISNSSKEGSQKFFTIHTDIFTNSLSEVIEETIVKTSKLKDTE